MKIYLAARYSRLEELQGYKADLEARGHVVTSRWLLGNHRLEDNEMSVEVGRTLAQEDLADILEADLMIAFTEPPRQVHNNRGGRHVEFGVALGLLMPVVVVGPRENVFHYLSEIRHAQWNELLPALKDDDSFNSWYSAEEDYIS